MDEAISEALTAFAQRVAGDGVLVSFREGAALIEGAVATATQARALCDLVEAHAGVSSVRSRLVVGAGEAVPHTQNR